MPWDEEPRCSICGREAVSVASLDTDHPEWRCAEHLPARMKELVALAPLVDDQETNCIVCGAPADAGRVEGGALIFYCQDHAPVF